MQSQKAVIAYFASKQLLPSGFAENQKAVIVYMASKQLLFSGFAGYEYDAVGPYKTAQISNTTSNVQNNVRYLE